MLLQFENGETFATGSTPYLYHPGSEYESTPRIILSVRLERIDTPAFVDTGGIYVLCSPEVAQAIPLRQGEGIPTGNLRTARGNFIGELHRVPLTLLPLEGEKLTIEATVFVPQADLGWPEGLPCILGMSGCLERLRFAIDPSTDTFYFGEI